MRAVKSNYNQSTEVKLIHLFKDKNLIGCRRNYPVFEKPDFTFQKQKVNVFADSCFWHEHDCRNLSPISNAEYWQTKISRNRKRDREVTKALEEKGWAVFRIFECKIKRSQLPKGLVNTIQQNLD